MGKVRRGRLEKGRLYPSVRVLRTHWSAPILAHYAEKEESMPPIGDRDWADIGGMEGWLRHRNSGGEQKSGMSLVLFPPTSSS